MAVDRRLQMAICVVPAMILGAWMLAFPIDVPATQPDSAGYLAFSSERSAGYPIFLKILGVSAEGPGPAFTAQIVLFSAALMFLAIAVQRTTGSTIAALVSVVASAVIPDLNKYHFILLTESVFLSLTIAICAASILAIYRPWLVNIVVLSVLIGLAIAVRPVGWAFVPLLAFLFILRLGTARSRPLRYLSAAVLPLALALILEQAAHSAYHGGERESLAGRHIFAKAALVEFDGGNPFSAASPYHPVWQALHIQFAPVREIIRESKDFGTRRRLTSNYEVYAQYRLARKELASAAKSAGVSTYEVMKRVGLARLKRASRSYLGLAWRHYRGLWSPFASVLPHSVAATKAFLRAHPALPFDGAGGALKRPPDARAIAPLGRVLFGLIWLASCAVIALGVIYFCLRRQLSRPFATAFFLSVMINGNFLLVALTAVAIPRYTLAMWPVMVLFALYLASWLAARLKERVLSRHVIQGAG